MLQNMKLYFRWGNQRRIPDDYSPNALGEKCAPTKRIVFLINLTYDRR